MKISIITDEVSADPETAIELGVQWCVREFELRGFFTDRVPRFSSYQKHHLRDILAEHQARIIALAPGLFKVTFPPPQPPLATLGWMERAGYELWSEAQKTLSYHLGELLPASLDYACELGAGVMVIFGFDREGAPPGDPPDEALNYLRLAAERAASAGVTLAVEPEAGFWADTGERTARMVRAVNHSALRVNWDAANAFFGGDSAPYPMGYEAVRGLVCHTHFKDSPRYLEGLPRKVARGQIDWPGQIQALIVDGYEGYVSVETHARPKVAEARASLERLRNLIADAPRGHGKIKTGSVSS